MASFTEYTNYNENAGVTSVVFGADKLVLEVEMNEVQEIWKSHFSNLVKSVVGDGVSDASKLSYSGGTFSIASGCYVIAGGHVLPCGGLSIAAANGSTVYLQAWEETVLYSGTLYKYGDQQSSETVGNWFKDSRVIDETSRRKVMKYTLATSRNSARTNVAVASISGGVAKVLLNSFVQASDSSGVVIPVAGDDVIDLIVEGSFSGSYDDTDDYAYGGLPLGTDSDIDLIVSGSYSTTEPEVAGTRDATPMTDAEVDAIVANTVVKQSLTSKVGEGTISRDLGTDLVQAVNVLRDMILNLPVASDSDIDEIVGG